MTKRASLAKQLALLLAGLCTALICTELYFRFVRPIEFMRIRTVEPDARGGWYGMIHRRSSTPGLPYELVPLLDRESIGVQVKTNSLGMRDDEPLPRETPDLLRVLAIGDSVTFGYRVAQDETFCAVLEKQLAEEPPGRQRFEVLNAGVSGYCSQDEAAAFAGKWLAQRPDMLLMCYCLNDPEFEPRQPLQRFFAPPRWWQHSATLRFLVQRSEGRKVRELGGGNYFRSLHAPSEASWKSVEVAFARVAEASRERKIPVLLAIFPMFSPDPWSQYPFREQHVQVAQAGRREGFVVLDLLPRFELEAPASLLIDPVDSHPNAAGHRIAALELQRFIVDNWSRFLDAK